MSKILVFGKNGQVGWELQRSLALMGDVMFLSRKDQGGDLLDIDTMVARIREEKPEIIFNAAAFTAVDVAETDQETAKRVNCDAVTAMANICKELNSLLIHYSTDYVFDGSGDRPWKEDDRIDPINVYGSTKALGEKAIIESGCKAYIFRTSWVYGVHGKNFIKTMLRLGQSRESLGVVADQIGTPTSAEFIADVSTWIALHKKLTKAEIIHLVPHGVTSWYDFALSIFANVASSDLSIKTVKPLKSTEYLTPAKRPLNSRLDNSKLLSLLPKNSVMNWQHYSNRVLKEILSE